MAPDRVYVGFQKEKGEYKHSLFVGSDKDSLFEPMEESPPKETEKNFFSEILQDYIDKIEGMHASIPAVMMLLPVMRKMIFEKKVFNYIKDNGTELESDESTYICHIDETFVTRSVKSIDQMSKFVEFQRIAPNAFLASLVAIYDGFLGQILKHSFELKPDMISSSEKMLSFSELSRLGSVEAARAHIVERESDSILRRSHAEQCDKLNELFSIKLAEDFDLYPDFLEICERRNLITHNNGIATQSYIDFCDKLKIEKENVKSGSDLRVTPDYLLAAIELFHELGIKLVHIVWRKLEKEPSDQRDMALNEVGFQLIEHRRYKLAQRVLRFASELRGVETDSTKRMILVNLANAHRLDGDQETAAKILDAHDWTATSDPFRMSVAAVLEKTDEAVDIMKQIGADGSIGEYEYRNWPVFEQLRDTREFLEAYRSIFGKPFTHTPEKIDVEDASSDEHFGEEPTNDAQADDDNEWPA